MKRSETPIPTTKAIEHPQQRLFTDKKMEGDGTGKKQEQAKNHPRLGEEEERESASAILALAAAAHQHQAASGSESDDPDKSRKRGESFESDMSSSSIPSNKANLSASSEGAAVLEAIDNVQTFPQKLMEMLDTEVVPEAMWWTDDGSAFAMDLSKFEEVLHKHFQSAKYPSFTRKLNKWGFRKLNTVDVTIPSSVVKYRHDLFLKGKPELLKQMSTKRKKKKDKQKHKHKDQDKKEKSARRNDSEDEDESETEDKKKQSKSKGKKRKRTLEAQRIQDELQMSSEGKEEVAAASDAAEIGREEEKTAFFNELQSSPAFLAARWPRRTDQDEVAESKDDFAPDAMRQQIQHQLSLSSSMATQRLSDPQGIAAALPPSPEMMREQALRLQGEQQALLRQIGQNRPQGDLRSLEQRLLLESLFATESVQQRSLALSLLHQQDRRQSLTSDFMPQRSLGSFVNTDALNLPGNLSLQNRLLAMREAASHSIAPSGSSGLGSGGNNLYSTSNLGNLRGTGVGTSGFPSNLASNFLGSNYGAGNSATSDNRSALQLQQQLGGGRLGSGFNSFGSLGSAAGTSQSNVSDTNVSLRLQMQLEQIQQQQQRQFGIPPSLGLSESNQTQTDSQLLTLLRDRQRLQAELLMIEQQQRQNRQPPE